MVDGDCRQFWIAARVTGAAIQAGAEDCPAGLMPAGDFLRLRRSCDDTDFDADKSEIKLEVRPDPVVICLKASHICGLDLLIDSVTLLTDRFEAGPIFSGQRCPEVPPLGSILCYACATGFNIPLTQMGTLATPDSTFRPHRRVGKVFLVVTPFTKRMGTLDKYPGAEPLPGYRLLVPLGRGGFGEVWKCEAPGGLHKAVKFVPGGGEQFRQELAAFAQVKAIRHPYLLTLERVELIGGELVMVMELADCQIQERFRKCQSEGLRGIPRQELLTYLGEAAEALDFLSNRYGLQHLDVKPENLFLVAEHVKVGDYGLVRRKEPAGAVDDGSHGFTPRYAAPEVLRGRVDPQSDQYSLALVYIELLTGVFPYTGKTAEQLMAQHLNSVANLSAVPSSDRQAVGRAVSKDPSDRFPSCSAFIRALAAAGVDPTTADDSDNHAFLEEAGSGVLAAVTGYHPTSESTPTVSNRGPQVVENDTAPPAPTPAAAYQPKPDSDFRRFARRGGNPKAGRGEQGPAPVSPEQLEPVLPVGRLHGMPASATRQSILSRSEFVAAVLEQAAQHVPPLIADNSLPEDALACCFLSTFPTALVPLKLVMVGEKWGMAVDQRHPSRVVLRWEAPIEVAKSARGEPRGVSPRPQSGFEVIVHLPAPPSAELIVTGASFGSPDEDLNRKIQEDLLAIMEEIRSLLQNLEERRRYPRFPAAFPVFVYPRYSDGVVGAPISGQCRDVSAGGVRFVTPTPVRTEWIFLEFKDIRAVAGLAILVRTLRTWQDNGGQGSVTSGQFRIGG